MMSVQKRRSITKTASYRLLAAFTTFIISWLVTDNYMVAGSIVSMEVVSKLVLYYVHERLWANLEWGIIKS